MLYFVGEISVSERHSQDDYGDCNVVVMWLGYVSN
jgi:hypothetical protein